MRVRSWLAVSAVPGRRSSPAGLTDLTVVVLAAALFAAGAQVARAMFPLMYLMGEDGSFVLVGLVAAAVYAAPFLAVPLASLRPERLLALGAGLVLSTRLALQVVHPITTWLAMAATGLALIGTALWIAALRDRGRELALGAVLGLALDSALRAPSRSWDLVWQDGPAALVLSLGLVAVAVLALARARRRAPAPGPHGCAALWLGPYLALQLLFLNNLGFVASQARVSFATASIVVLGADAAGALALAGRRPLPPVALGFAGIAGAVLAGSLTAATGPPVIASLVALQVLATAALGTALPTPDRGPRRTALGVVGASLSFLVVVLLWQLDADTPLPFPREVVPAAAALALGIPSLHRPRTPRPAAERLDHRAFGMAGGLAVAAMALSAWLWVDAPSADTVVLAGGRVRVVQYNIRGALNPSGQIEPDDVARAIASSDPDVVILQEVARGWPVFGGGDVLARLQQRLDMAYRYEPAADGQFGNAILSRLPMTPVSAGPLPDVPGKQGRSYLAVRLDLGAAGSLLVVGAHLEGDDIGQIEALIRAWGGEEPAVVAGDLNMQPSDETNVRRFTDAGLVDAEGATGDPCRTTSAEPTSACDRVSWVFATGDVRFLGFRIGTVAASDHLPVHVILAVPAS